MAFTWCLKGFRIPVYRYPALVFSQGQLNPMPIAVVELDPRGPNLDRSGPEIQMDMKVTVEQLDGKVILNNIDNKKDSTIHL